MVVSGGFKGIFHIIGIGVGLRGVFMVVIMQLRSVILQLREFIESKWIQLIVLFII